MEARMDILQQAIAAFKAQTARRYVEIHAEPCADLTVYQSKFGGIPYLPEHFPYPHSKLHPEQPLRLLAQINFAEMPHLDDYPEQGILQIYLNPADDQYFGCDKQLAHFEHMQPENQSEYRVIYHETVDMSAPLSNDIPAYDGEFLAEQPERITFAEKVGYMPYDSGSDAFLEAFAEIYNSYAEQPVESKDALLALDGCELALEKTFPNRARHQLGGYRADVWDARWMDTEVLLLQIISDDSMQWGDDGIAHFTMKRDDLRRRDFSRVDYDWECY